MGIERGVLARDLAFGCMGSAVALSASYGTLQATRHLLQGKGIVFEQSLFFHLYDWLSSSIRQVSSGAVRSALRVCVIAYPILIVPIAEEWFFRGLVYSWQEKGETTTIGRMYRIFFNASLFGAIHLNFYHGLGTLPVFLVATISGVVYACLREWTKSWRASAFAHSMSNAFVIAFKTLRI